MAQAGGCVRLVVGVAEAEPREQPPGAFVSRMVPGNQPMRAQIPERMGDDRHRGFLRQTLPPVRWAEVCSELENACARWTQPEAATPDVLTGREEEDRPVLHSVLGLAPDLLGEPVGDVLAGEPRAGVDELRHLRIAPESTGQIEVALRPGAKPDAGGLSKVVGHGIDGRRHRASL